MTCRARPAFPALLLALIASACTSSGSPGSSSSPSDAVTLRVTNEAGEPVQLRYLYGSSVPTTLGTVRTGATEEFSIRYSRAGDLRVTGDFVERRTGTSNPIMDLRPGDVLDLTINQRKELRLERAAAG